MPLKNIDQLLLENKNLLFPTLAAIDLAIKNGHNGDPLPWTYRKTRSKAMVKCSRQLVDDVSWRNANEGMIHLKKELEAARYVQVNELNEALKEHSVCGINSPDVEVHETEDISLECQCCYDPIPLHKDVRCNGQIAHVRHLVRESRGALADTHLGFLPRLCSQKCRNPGQPI